MKLAYSFLILLAVISIALADVFLKQASKSGDFSMAMKSPWFWGGTALYLFQIFAFTYLFVSGVELSVVGILQTALYAIVVLGAGYFIYKETLTAPQYIGLAMSVIGVLLINFKL